MFEEAVQLCGIAASTGTRVLFATPHAHADWDHHPRTREREQLFADSFPAALAAARRRARRPDRVRRAPHNTPATTRPNVRTPRRPLRSRNGYVIARRVGIALDRSTERHSKPGRSRDLNSFRTTGCFPRILL